jgi:hypothetical protein
MDNSLEILEAQLSEACGEESDATGQGEDARIRRGG